MRCTRLSRVLVPVLLFTIATISACGSATTTRTGISGTVLDWGAFGGTVPAADVQVECVDASTGKRVLTTQSDHGGSFFLAVPAGRYEVASAPGSRPVWVRVEVAAGKVTTLEPFIGTRYGPQASPPEKRLREMFRREAIALGMRRQTARLAVSGATVGAATKLFGTASTLPAETHVWVCCLTGEVEGWSSATAARDLGRGGFVAYELHASTLERLATRSVSKKWRLLDWAGPDDWGGTSLGPLF